MGLRSFFHHAATVLIVSAPFLLTSASNSVHGQGLSYSYETFTLNVKPLGGSEYTETNLYENVGDRLLTIASVNVKNMNTYRVRFRSVLELDNAGNLIVSNEKIKNILPGQTVTVSNHQGWTASTSGVVIGVKWIWYQQEDFNDDGDFDDVGEGEQLIDTKQQQYQPTE